MPPSNSAEESRAKRPDYSFKSIPIYDSGFPCAPMEAMRGRGRGQANVAQHSSSPLMAAAGNGHGQPKSQPAGGFSTPPPSLLENIIRRPNFGIPKPPTPGGRLSGEPIVPGAATAQAQGQPGPVCTSYSDSFPHPYGSKILLGFSMRETWPHQLGGNVPTSPGGTIPTTNSIDIHQKLPDGSRAYPCYRCLVNYLDKSSNKAPDQKFRLCVDSILYSSCGYQKCTHCWDLSEMCNVVPKQYLADARALAEEVIGLPPGAETSRPLTTASRAFLGKICRQMIAADQQIKASLLNYVYVWNGNRGMRHEDSLSSTADRVKNEIRELNAVLEAVRSEQQAQGAQLRNLDDRMKQLLSNSGQDAKKGGHVKKEDTSEDQ